MPSGVDSPRFGGAFSYQWCDMENIVHVETRSDPSGEFILRLQTADERWLEFSLSPRAKLDALSLIVKGASKMPVSASTMDDELRILAETINAYLAQSKQ